jgi:WXG100 family type VII secretion target
MGKVIRVTPEQLEQSSRKIADHSQAYTQIYRQLLSEAGSMGSAWEGEDNQAFVNQINGFCDELRKMAEKLKTASEALAQQSTAYKTKQSDTTAGARTLPN